MLIIRASVFKKIFWLIIWKIAVYNLAEVWQILEYGYEGSNWFDANILIDIRKKFNYLRMLFYNVIKK